MCDLVKSFDTIPHHILNALSNVGVLSTLQVVLQLPVQSTTTCGVGGPLILTSKPLFLSSTGFHPRLTALYCKWIPLTIFHGLQTLKLFRLYSTTLSNSGTIWFFNLMWTLFPMCMGVSVWSYIDWIQLKPSLCCFPGNVSPICSLTLDRPSTPQVNI